MSVTSKKTPMPRKELRDWIKKTRPDRLKKNDEINRKRKINYDANKYKRIG